MKTTTPRKRKQVQRPERMVNIIEADEWGYTVKVTVGDDVDLYDLCPGEVGGVKVWLVRKVQGDLMETLAQTPYIVDIGVFGPSCDCKAGKYRGTCRHVDFIRALTDDGKIPDLSE